MLNAIAHFTKPAPRKSALPPRTTRAEEAPLPLEVLEERFFSAWPA